MNESGLYLGLYLHASRWVSLAILLVSSGFSPGVGAAAKRPLGADDFGRFVAVDGLACSRDGRWIAYTAETSDLDADERKTQVWMADYDGTSDLELTAKGESASNPKFSPDGRYVSFVSARPPDGNGRLFLLDRRGGEAQPLEGVDGDINDYAWSPDGTHLVISLSAGEEDGKAKTPKPIVIDRLHFKEDVVGYLTAADHKQLYLYDLAQRKLSPLTTDPQLDDTLPAFSPDGRTVAFLSTHSADADRSGRSEIDVIDARSGASRRKLVEFFAPNKAALLFTPDGTQLIYTSGRPARLNAYIQDRLSVVTLADGKSR
jgi:Tol biopolymer transport system component